MVDLLSEYSGHKSVMNLSHCARSNIQCACADSESFVRGGPTLTMFFLLMGRGIKEPL